mmetsp:Transcript_159450/g.511589  ORF Transcript_159450/g.511589 Transcript_159450/m.511589 type:complete len:337 (-) Transcript_159450:2074-3084(-)
MSRAVLLCKALASSCCCDASSVSLRSLAAKAPTNLLAPNLGAPPAAVDANAPPFINLENTSPMPPPLLANALLRVDAVAAADVFRGSDLRLANRPPSSSGVPRPLPLGPRPAGVLRPLPPKLLRPAGVLPSLAKALRPAGMLRPLFVLKLPARPPSVELAENGAMPPCALSSCKSSARVSSSSTTSSNSRSSSSSSSSSASSSHSSSSSSSSSSFALGGPSASPPSSALPMSCTAKQPFSTDVNDVGEDFPFFLSFFDIRCFLVPFGLGFRNFLPVGERFSSPLATRIWVSRSSWMWVCSSIKAVVAAQSRDSARICILNCISLSFNALILTSNCS